MNDSKKIKVFYVITKANWGGAQKYVYDLATSLPKDKFEVSVVHGEGEILSKKLREAQIEATRISEMKRDIGIFSEIKVFLKLLKLFFDRKPDAIHLNSSKAAGLGALAGRLILTPKIIFTVHGWAFNENRNKLSKFFIKIVSWLTVLLSTKTIVLSRQNYKQAKKFPFLRRKLVLIPNGIKEIDFRLRESAREFLGGLTKAPKDKFWLGTISELHKNKGLEYLIKAMAKLKEKPVVFIIGDGEKRKSLEKKIRKYELEKDIFLMGFIKDASSFLKAFDIFTLTSIKEGHPYAVLEAGLARLPVIGSKISGIEDILDEKKGILVEKKKPKKIAKAIKNLLENSEEREKLGKSLKKKVRKEFSFKKMLDKTIALYSGK